MFSQDFFLAIILQDSSPGEGGQGVGMMWGGAGREGRGRGSMNWAIGLEW